VFDASVMGGAERSETQTENVAIIGAVTDQERTVGLVGQLRLSFVEAHSTPVPPALSHASQPASIHRCIFCNFNTFVFPNSHATQLRCGGKYYVLCRKFHALFSSEKIVKIC